jgi:hypothetical protein
MVRHNEDTGTVVEDVDGEDVVAAPVDPAEEVSIEEFLGMADDQVTDWFRFVHLGVEKRILCAALTDGEQSAIVKMATRKGEGGKRRPDLMVAKDMICAYSLNKAAGRLSPSGAPLPGTRCVVHSELRKQLGGRMTELSRHIAKISGTEDRPEDLELFG